MHTPTLNPPLRLGRSWFLRAANDLGDHLAVLARSARFALQRLAERRRERRQLEAALELSDHTLRDMGAPDWLQSQAQSRRDAQRFERELLRMQPRVGDVRHYY